MWEKIEEFLKVIMVTLITFIVIDVISIKVVEHYYGPDAWDIYVNQPAFLVMDCKTFFSGYFLAKIWQYFDK